MLKINELNQELSFKKTSDSVCGFICELLNPYIYEIFCFLYSGKYMTITSKMKYMLYNLFTLSKLIAYRAYRAICKIKNNEKTILENIMKNFRMIPQIRSKLPVTFIIKLFLIVVKKICIRTFCCQYIKMFRFLKCIFLLFIAKENVNNALNLLFLFLLKSNKSKILLLVYIYKKKKTMINNVSTLLFLKKSFLRVWSILICKSFKPYIYEMSCFLYSGRYQKTTSKMNFFITKNVIKYTCQYINHPNLQTSKNKIMHLYKTNDF